MKKLILLVLLTVVAFEIKAGTTGTLYLMGRVDANLSISIAPQARATTLILTQTVSDLKVAEITENTNSLGNYKIKFQSQNLGKLKHEQDLFSVEYSLTYAGSTFSLANEKQMTFTPDSESGLHTKTRDLGISYQGTESQSLPAGVYDDTITVSISGE